LKTKNILFSRYEISPWDATYQNVKRIEELIKFKDSINLLVGIIDLIKDLIEAKIKFGSQFCKTKKN
jgi:hypothetical protein